MLNGVDVDNLVETVNAINTDPGLAKFKFRTATEWISGARSRTKIETFYGAGAEDASRKKIFTLEGDEPSVLLGTNKAPNAVETVLSAFDSCLAVGFAYNAAARGIKVESLDFSIEGGIDLHGFLGLSDEIRPGYQNIRVKSDAPGEKIEELCEHVQKTSPVLDIISNAVPVAVNLEESYIKEGGMNQKLNGELASL